MGKALIVKERGIRSTKERTITPEMATQEDDCEENDMKVPRSRTTTDVQRYKIDKLMKNPEKPVHIPGTKEAKLPRVFRPPEFIRNIWGSSAGVGSGDFHIYRNMRRRQYAREKFMDQMSEQERLDAEYQERLLENQVKCEERANKKRQKRLKKKQKNRNTKKQKTKEDTESSEEQESDENEESADEKDDALQNEGKEREEQCNETAEKQKNIETTEQSHEDGRKSGGDSLDEDSSKKEGIDSPVSGKDKVTDSASSESIGEEKPKEQTSTENT